MAVKSFVEPTLVKLFKLFFLSGNKEHGSNPSEKADAAEEKNIKRDKCKAKKERRGSQWGHLVLQLVVKSMGRLYALPTNIIL